TAKIFVKQKTNWIQKKLAQQAERNVQEKQFVDNESFLFLGEQLTLRLYEEDSVPSIKKSASEIKFYGRLNKISKPAIRGAIIDWYKKQADGYLTARTHWLSDVTSLHPNSITIKSYKARWGSCSIKSEINFNWQLIQAPPEVIDYVITHELCHLSHHNHSPKFWALVEHYIPDFKLRRQWLKDNGYKLTF
ncbi:MAG: M48 family metallopeptidase, partial [Methylophagaceae bacterium]